MRFDRCNMMPASNARKLNSNVARPKQMKTLIVDEYALFREGLCYVLHALDEQMIILQASDCHHAFKLATGHSDLDLVLLDPHITGNKGCTTLESFVENYPALPVVILSDSRRHDDVRVALNAGAVGYIPKNTDSRLMLYALQIVLAGGIYVPVIATPDNINIFDDSAG